MNRNRYTDLDDLVAAEVRSEIARHKGVSVKSIAEKLDVRRASLSARVNGHAPFSPSLLAAVAALLGCTAAEFILRAERQIAARDSGKVDFGATRYPALAAGAGH